MALMVSGLMAVPDWLVWLPGLVTVTTLVTFQVKVVEPLSRRTPSVAVTVTEQAQAVVGVPVMVPLEEMDSPAGSPVAARSGWPPTRCPWP